MNQLKIDFVISYILINTIIILLYTNFINIFNNEIKIIENMIKKFNSLWKKSSIFCWRKSDGNWWIHLLIITIDKYFECFHQKSNWFFTKVNIKNYDSKNKLDEKRSYKFLWEKTKRLKKKITYVSWFYLAKLQNLSNWSQPICGLKMKAFIKS